MSSFTTPLIMEMLPNRIFMVAQEFQYVVGNIDSTDIIIVPKGFKTDLASTPRFLWWFMPPHGTYGKAGVIHDYIYRTLGTPNKPKRSRKEADEIFYEGMLILGVPKWKASLMYYATRIFGAHAYKV